MRRRERKIIVVGRQRPFDENAWKHLLLTYAYYLHDERERQRRDEQKAAPAEDVDGPNGDAS